MLSLILGEAEETAGGWLDFVCCIIVDKTGAADSRTNPGRGTITLVGDEVIAGGMSLVVGDVDEEDDEDDDGEIGDIEDDDDNGEGDGDVGANDLLVLSFLSDEVRWWALIQDDSSCL